MYFEYYHNTFCKGWSKEKALKQYQRYMEDEMKLCQGIATEDFRVAECNAICAFAPACEAPKKSRFGAKVCNQEKEVENTMTTYNEIEATRKYLNGRVQSVFWNKRDELGKQFRIYASEIPRTYKELIDAIKNDKYTLDTKRTAKIDAAVADIDDDENYFNFSVLDGIKFDLPTAPDRAGYNAATTALDKKIQEVKDVINVSTPADGLKALQELEAWTPAGKSS